MNKRITAMLAAGAFAFGPGEAVAQHDDKCAPVYDENSEVVNPELDRAIGEFAANGVTVHVQLLKDSRDLGIADDTDAGEFQRKLAEECGRANTNDISIFVSDKPRVYNIVRDGKIEDDLPKSEVDDQLGDFRKDLRDFSTPHQEDVANLLDAINPYNAEPNAESKNPEATSGGEGLDVPMIPIMGSLLGMTLLIGAGARIRRGFKVGSAYRDQRFEADQALTALSGVVTEADEQLKYIPQDDAKDLRSAKDAAEGAMVGLSDVVVGFQETYRRERVRFWPSIEYLEEQAEPLRQVATEAGAKTSSTQGFIEELSEYMLRLEAHSKDFGTKLADVHAKAESLLGDGWDIGAMAEEIQQFDAMQARIEELRAKSYVEQPGDLVKDGTQQLNELANKITALPKRREQIDKTVSNQPQLIAQNTKASDDAKAQLDILRAKYDDSCYKDINNLDTKLESKMVDLRGIQENANQLVGVKSLSAVEQTETYVAEFSDVVSSLDAMRSQIKDRVALVEQIKAHLPEVIDGLGSDLAAVKSYANEKFKEDVEGATRDEIEALGAELSGFIANEVERDRPRYLLVDQGTDKLKDRILQITQQAKSEKSEMDELRAAGESMSTEAQRDLEALERYISSNRSDVGGRYADVLSVEVPQFTDRLDRSGLRAQKNSYASLIGQIESAMSSAQAEVRAAEAERERQRQAEIERRRREEEAAHAALIASQQSSSYGSSSSGFDSGGGFGGGFDSGGSFGGGGDSGGSF